MLNNRLFRFLYHCSGNDSQNWTKYCGRGGYQIQEISEAFELAHELGLEDIPAFVRHRGDATAGAVLVALNTLDGQSRLYQRRYDLMSGERHWEVLAEGTEAEVEASIEKQRGFDRDLWVIEVEDRDGRHLLDQPGLAD